MTTEETLTTVIKKLQDALHKLNTDKSAVLQDVAESSSLLDTLADSLGSGNNPDGTGSTGN